MELRAVIIDDEQKGINTLKILIAKHIDAVKIVAESISASTGIIHIENYKPDIVFLDINMPEMNGFELLEKLSWKGFNLIFTTAHQEFGLKAIKNNAVDYLLKPIDYRDLQFAINKIKNNLEKNKIDYTALLNTINQPQKKKIIINSKFGIESVDANQIIFLESKSNYTLIWLSNYKTILTSKTLKEFELQLSAPEMNFMRVHNSFLINLNHVSRYLKEQETIIMINEQLIPLAKSKKSSFFEWLQI
ncbi:MAG: LytTR family DNA-binding domain-containing protein [Bacteroidota bacterium]|nr:LytTR family DNA-binding domain-containing protein [Bacteroidota bacterium]MDP3146731.1 LytTR family DNA-binding domain-containing protein [Bacteroidota bacterium]MDP3557170.1 LytTR family DNA-binding domain-containing protein [Bacteroidota bacterium]